MMKSFLNNQQGATAIEYGFICAMVVLVMLASLMVLGNSSTGLLGNTSKAVQKYAPN